MPIKKEESRLKVFENRILRRIFGLKRDENGEWRRLHNEELHSLYRSPSIVRVNKPRRFRWACHVARMEEGRYAFEILTLSDRVIPTGITNFLDFYKYCLVLLKHSLDLCR